MNLIMSGLDHNTAGIDVREKFSIQESCVEPLCQIIKDNEGVYGCVIIATCNRMEIYVSAEEGFSLPPCSLLMTELGLDKLEYVRYFKTRQGDDAFQHLMETAAGLHSQIFGEDQIVTQVKTALNLSREANAADSILETVFRYAISCAKKIKTEVRLSSVGASAADSAVSFMSEFFESLKETKVLVIGNGEMGRLAAGLLADKAACVTVTIREYKYRPVIVPNGCQTVSYGDRYKILDNYDAVLSATTSPHYTISKELLSCCGKIPALFIDLAVPRDIDPEITDLGAKLINIDSLKTGAEKTGLDEAAKIIEQQKVKFYKWLEYKKSLNEVRA